MVGSRQDADESLLLSLLNSTPVVDGHITDQLADAIAAYGTRDDRGPAVPSSPLGVPLEESQYSALVESRTILQQVIRGELDATAAAPMLRGVSRVPRVEGRQIVWDLVTPKDRRLAVRAVLAWDALERRLPGRLKPCFNDECRLFFVDHSRSGSGRWCSMAVCGNRMKARRHHARSTRPEPPEQS